MKDLDLKAIGPMLTKMFGGLGKYFGFFVFMLIAGAYAYTVFTINSLSNPDINQSEVLAETLSLPVPRVDDEAARQLQTLKDNSVNVQTLFEQGRTNPFQE